MISVRWPYGEPLDGTMVVVGMFSKQVISILVWEASKAEVTRSCDFKAHMCTGMILSNYKFFVNPLFKLISIEHVIIGSKTQWKTM